MTFVICPAPMYKKLKEDTGLDQYNKIIARGITAVIPREIVTNPIAARLETSDRQMILNNSGSYRYKNPINNIDIKDINQENIYLLPENMIFDNLIISLFNLF